jgi:hypothetical protein
VTLAAHQPAREPRRLNWESLATGAMGLGLAFSALPALMVSNPPLITYSDVFLLVGMVMLLPKLLRGRFDASPIYVLGALCLLCMSLLSFALVPQAGHEQGLLRISYALIVLPTAMMLWRPSTERIGFMAACYVAGTSTSVVYGVIQGPEADGRNLGLTPHPNALGLTSLLSIALLPFLMRLRPSARWAVLGAGVVCAYGVWISGSRGSLIGLVLVSLVFILRERSATAALFSWGACIPLLIAWPRLVDENSNNVLSRVLGGGSAQDATGQREVALREALDQVQQHPFLGNGFGTIRAAQIAYLQVLTALGILGLIAFVLILAALALPILRAQEPLRLLAYAAVGYVLVAPFTDSVSDTLVWAPLSLCVLIRPPRGPDPALTSAAAEQVSAGRFSAARSLQVQLTPSTQAPFARDGLDRSRR